MTGSERSHDHGDPEGGEEGAAPPGEPWYRKPIVSLTIGFFVAMLLGIAIYALADKNSGHTGTTQTPTSPTAPASVTAPAP